VPLGGASCQILQDFLAKFILSSCENIELSLHNLDDVRSLYENRVTTDDDNASSIDCVYDEIVSIVHDCAIAVVPQTRKGFF